MLLKPDQQRVKDLLSDTITLLCKNSLFFKTEFTVEALIGITLDKSEVLLMNINETIILPVEQRVDKELPEHVNRQFSNHTASVRKSTGNSDADASYDLKRTRNSSTLSRMSPASKSLPSRSRSIAPPFTDSNATRGSPISTQLNETLTPIQSDPPYFNSTHSTSSFSASRKRRRLEMLAVSSLTTETNLVFPDPDDAQESKPSSHKPNRNHFSQKQSNYFNTCYMFCLIFLTVKRLVTICL